MPSRYLLSRLDATSWANAAGRDSDSQENLQICETKYRLLNTASGSGGVL